MEKLTSGQHNDPHVLSDNSNVFNGDHYNRSLHEVVGFYIRLEVGVFFLVSTSTRGKLMTITTTSFRSFSCTRMSLLLYR